MKSSRISLMAFAIIAVLAVFSAACGPTYVVHDNGYAQGGYVEPIYQPGLSIVVVGGQQGYYDSYHHFYPTVVLNGSSGYYNSSHVFVSSSPAVQQAVQSKKPFYAGPAGGSAAAQTAPTKSDPNGIGGGMGRSNTAAPATSQPTPITGKSNYTTPSSVPKPSGGMGRSSSAPSAPASRPSSSGGMSRSSHK